MIPELVQITFLEIRDMPAHLRPAKEIEDRSVLKHQFLRKMRQGNNIPVIVAIPGPVKIIPVRM